MWALPAQVRILPTTIVTVTSFFLPQYCTEQQNQYCTEQQNQYCTEQQFLFFYNWTINFFFISLGWLLQYTFALQWLQSLMRLPPFTVTSFFASTSFYRVGYSHFFFAAIHYGATKSFIEYSPAIQFLFDN
jgi:hypothetical protein